MTSRRRSAGTPRARAGWLLGMVIASACGDGTPGPATSPPTPFDLPIAVSSGGPVLVAPRVQPIFYPGFPFGVEVDAFLAKLQISTYWPAVVGEYGVGPLTALPGHVSSVAAGATIVSSAIEDLFAQTMIADAADLGAPSGDTIYPLFFPPDTTITSSGVALCQPGAAGGFHAEWSVNGMRTAVVVIPTCASFGGGQLTGISALTPVISHELAEAATDPFPTNAPAFINTDAEHAIWSVAVHGGEIADLCENEAPNLTTPADIGLPVSRIWSNAAVMAGTGPCVPVPPGEVYFVAVPELPDRVAVQRSGVKFTVPALTARLGIDATVNVELRAEAGMQDSWTVGALEFHADSMSSPQPTGLTGVKGQTLRLPVTPTEVAAGIFPLVVSSVRGSAHHFWFGVVQRQ